MLKEKRQAANLCSFANKKIPDMHTLNRILRKSYKQLNAIHDKGRINERAYIFLVIIVQFGSYFLA
jgi:hypothetical protein